jgi:diguanylate cyclase
VNKETAIERDASSPVAAGSVAKTLQLALAISLLVGVILAAFNSSLPFERYAQNFRDTLGSKKASGDIHLIEIDAKSLHQLDRWPWPRSYHAKLVDTLSAAGATQIVFDVDFSSHSDPAEDAAFAAAIDRADDKVVLPTFRQAASMGEANADIEILPIEPLRRHAFLGAVNVHPNTIGQINRYPYGIITAATARPSIAALLADASGPLDQQFRIDQSIEVSSIPAHSFSDVISGKVDKSAFSGKKVIVGATAIELGDRYATNRFGVIPGVLIQALAAETLLSGGAIPALGPWPMVLLAFAVLTIFARLYLRVAAAKGWAAASLILPVIAIPMAADYAAIAHLEVMPAIAMIVAFGSTRYIAGIQRSLSIEQSFDSETGLLNLASWRKQAQVVDASAVIVAEIKNFEDILSTLNAADAQKFVKTIAARLALASGSANLYRVGHEQFGWIVVEQSTEQIEVLIDAAARLFSAAFLFEDRSIRVTMHFGIARATKADATASLNKAALAARKAADLGSRHAWYDDDLAQNTDQSLFILSEFENALVSGQISVAYQPKYDFDAGKVTAAEALVRWSHPARGIIRPDLFIPTLEQANLMEQLTLFVLRNVLDQLEKWNGCGLAMSCAVNLSGTLLADRKFVDQAIREIANSEIDPSMLTIELTETSALLSIEQAASALRRFKLLGARLSIDDYGTGQSTLSYLKRFDADEIKIDQSFVRTIATDPAARIMVRSTVELAKALRMKIVAEGIEDSAAMEVVRSLGCDMVQGWHIGKPVAGDQFTSLWGASADAQALRRAG